MSDRVVPDRRVYFIRPIGMEGPVKIGCSKWPADRLQSLMAWSPFRLEVAAETPGGFDLERNIHDCFADQYSHSEWFHPSKRLTAVIDGLKGGKALADVLDLSDRRGRVPYGRSGCIRPPERELYTSYCHRLSWAERRVRKESGEWRRRPPDVTDIMHRWSGYRKTPEPPSATEIERLEAIIADPLTHLLPPYQKAAA